MGTRKERKVLLLFGTGWVVRRNGAVCNPRTHPADARTVANFDGHRVFGQQKPP
jgi:hypothetical protein